MEKTENTEAQADIKSLENELKVGLLHAEIKSPETTVVPLDTAINKPMLNLGSPLVKVFCRLKNGAQFRMVTKELPLDIKEKLQHFAEVKDNEIAIYKNALDQYGSEHLSPELIQMVNKYANSPLAPLIEFEIEKVNLMRAEIKLLTADNQSKKD